jgi:methylmalonyl-CoA decarboxylase
MTLIQAQLKQRLGTTALDHYAKRNTLGADLIAEMLGSLDEFAREGVGVGVIRSASNERVWSAGHDVDELPLADVDPIPYDEPLEELRAVKRFPAPVIAMVHGSVWGGAFDLVMACDIVLSRRDGGVRDHIRKARASVQCSPRPSWRSTSTRWRERSRAFRGGGRGR